MNKNAAGQVLIGAIILLVLMTIMIPAIVFYIQKESDWSVKAQRSTRAFQLAEAGLERGYQAMILSTTTLAKVEAGFAQTNYSFDHAYSDLPGGQYEINIVGNPVAQTITITGVGKDTSGNEIRAIQVVYATPGAYPAAIYAVNSASIQGNPFVEWGPVASPGPITTDAAHIYPRYYSSGDILPFDTNFGAPPNTDNYQWWSYYNLPPAPQIDLPGYKSTAGPGCTDQAGCLTSACHVCYYTAANYPTLSPGTNNYFAHGADTAIIVEGNLSLSGNYGNGSEAAVPIPSAAWKEYGSQSGGGPPYAAWTHYKTFDPAAPATYAAAVTANYAPVGLTDPSAINKVFIHGFLYIGGTISISGGGNGSIIGSMFCATVANLGSSHVTVYYDNNVIGNIKVANTTLARTSWQETHCSWSGANPTCP